MPRRHGWLRDYHQEYDWDDDRLAPGQERSPFPPDRALGNGPSSPVTINININLGDLIDRVVRGKSPKEALEEALEEYEQNNRSGRRRLDE